MKGFSSRIRLAVYKFAGRRWYVVLVAALSALDAFILVVPNEALLIPAILARPKRWLGSTLVITLGSALGAVAFAAVISIYGEPFLLNLFPELHNSSAWVHSTQILQEHSLWGLTLVSMSPFPQHAAVAIAGLAHVPLAVIFLSVLVGRAFKYFFIAWCLTHSSRWARRIGIRSKP